MIEFLKPYIPEIITFLAGAGAWSYERNKRKTELAKSKAQLSKYETENNRSIMELYQQALDDLKKRYDEKFSELQLEIEVLRKRLTTRDAEYTKLKNEFQEYKKKHL